MTTKDILEKEIEARLQTIPSAYDRRKMRGLIQRIRTHDRKIYEKLVERAKQASRDEVADLIDYENSYVRTQSKHTQAGVVRLLELLSQKARNPK